ncbi:MAG: hypothetical protein WCR45_12605, partial [Bacteroidaceae bacterium]
IIACNDDGVNKCFSTNNGGDSWTEMPNLDVLGSIKYSPMHDVYFMTVNSTNGLRYTSDNGQTWINHPSFKTVSLADIALTETDKLIAAGWGSLFYSTSFLGENAIIDNLSVINSNTIDIDFSIPMNLASCTNKINYTIESVNDDKYAALSIESITQDLVDNSIFHIKMSADFDTDFVRIIVRDVYDSNEYPLLFNEPGYIRTIETDFSTETANVIANKPILSCRDGFVTIEKVTPESTIKIYDVMGKAIFMGKTEGSTFNIQLQKGSIYIIQVNSKRFKVAI